MIKIVIIGSGNVAQHLITAFAKSNEVDIVQVFSRQKKSTVPLLDPTKITNDYKDLTEAHLYIIAVSDNAIASVSSKLPFENRLVVHTSGSVSIDLLDKKNRRGIFYPLQTFTKNVAIDFKPIPICLESENESDFDLLEKVAQSISNNAFNSDEKQRKALHVSAVFVNNFVNEMYRIGNEICEENKVSFEVLKPLILETVNKVMVLSPNEAQTGPAKRNDTQTIEAHLDFLSNENQATIYKILTQSIQNNGKEL
ncbi:Rossmann-like and DUF2520 domain-containing protein [uncultured Flavobacterium sp.]|jgi:predicted short-subunit dehydrogenase-like oxidoreductase (DUF2520 family)|uniref:Rossmann-like and DUF2520 domain-containing protein n=1 Tax=uncultured Flavobacterium sp. TaxID=165435 RepID=UPI0030CA2320